MPKSERPIHRRPRRVSWRIVDSDALIALVDEACQKPPYNGSQSEVARRTGIKQSTLSLLLAGKQQAVTRTTLRRLIALIGDEQEEAIAACLFDSDAIAALEAQDDWLRAAEYRLEGEVSKEGFILPAASLDRLAERQHLLQMMVQLCPAATRAFFDECSARGFSGSPRAGLALCSVIEPLLQSRNTRGIERGWQDLTGKEFVSFVEAGLTRESILLARSMDHIRAQESDAFVSRRVGLDSTSDVRAYYGRTADPLKLLSECWSLVEETLAGRPTGEPQIFVDNDEPGLM